MFDVMEYVVIEWVCVSLVQFIYVWGELLLVCCSVGISCFLEDGIDVDILLCVVDYVMYVVKCLIWFSEDEQVMVW